MRNVKTICNVEKCVQFIVFCFKIIFWDLHCVAIYVEKIEQKNVLVEKIHTNMRYVPTYIYSGWANLSYLSDHLSDTSLAPTHPAHFNSLVKALITEEPQVDGRASFVDSAGAKLRVRCHVALAGFPCFPLKQIHQVNIN